MKRVAVVLTLIIGILIAGLNWSGSATADKRVALVVGNSNYASTTPLRTPVNDATDVASALERLGFEVVRGLDLDHQGMRDKIKAFSERLSGASVGLFYYGGHGLQVSGKNYLIPVDARLKAASDLDFSAIDVDLVLRNMERETPTNIVFLDACRDNPLAANLAGSMGTRSGTINRGLARVEAGVGTFIAFATQPGNVALDGRGRHSPFAAALLRTIERPGLTISDIMISVRRDVLRETGDRQVPWDHSSLTGQFYFIPPPAVAAPTVPAAPGIELPQTGGQESDNDAISSPALLSEVRERLFELNFDPGPLTGPVSEADREAVRQFQQKSNLSPTGEISRGLLKRLRETARLKPWGTIVFARKELTWGMAWGQDSRQAAVERARATCGPPDKCPAEISFFGAECGAFAYSNSSWAIVARRSMQQAKDDALADCSKRGRSCRIVAAVCADGTESTAVR